MSNPISVESSTRRVSPAMIETLSTLSAEPLPIIGAEFAQFMAGQRERFGGIIRRLGITAVD